MNKQNMQQTCELTIGNIEAILLRKLSILVRTHIQHLAAHIRILFMMIEAEILDVLHELEA